MNFLGLRKPHATYTITISEKDYHIPLSNKLNKELKKIYDNLLKNEDDTINLFRKKLLLSPSFCFYQNFRTSCSIHSLENNEYIPKKLIKEIRKEFYYKLEKEVLKNLKEEIKSPKLDHYIDIKYNKNGSSFFDIRKEINKNPTERKLEYFCKDKNLFIHNPKITITSIEEDFYNYKIHWNFKYPINIISTIGMDMNDATLEFINNISSKKFKSLEDFYVINFLIYKGSVNIKEIKDKYSNRVEFLSNKNSPHIGHTLEHLWIVNLKGLKNKDKYIDNMYNALFK